MRTFKIASIAAALIVSPLAASAEPLESFQLKDHVEAEGKSSGQTRLYRITATSTKVVSFLVKADGSCRYGLQKGPLRDYRPASGEFPIEFTDSAKVGEVYILSFSQTRTAWLARTPCSYSFSVK